MKWCLVAAALVGTLVASGCKKKRAKTSNDAVVSQDASRSDETTGKAGASAERFPQKEMAASNRDDGRTRPEVGEGREVTESPGGARTPERPEEEPKPPAPPAQDIRLLLTMADIKGIAGDKVRFVRRNLPGVVNSKETEALMFAPEKGDAFGFSIQVYYDKPGPKARQRFDNLFATYPNAVEIAPVAGRTFFAYFGDVIHVGFLHPMTGKIVVLSCGQKFCDSDQLYELAKKVASRVR